MAWTTFNPKDMAGGALDATKLVFSTGGAGAVRAVDGKTSGKYYFEVGIGYGNFTTYGAGVVPGTASLVSVETANVGATVTRYGAEGSQMLVNGINLSTNVFDPIGLACIAVDLDAHLVWLKANAADSWNNNAAANPATGAGGFDISMYAGEVMYPAGMVNANTSTTWIASANFGQAAFQGVVPSGFTAGWPQNPQPDTVLVWNGIKAWPPMDITAMP